MKLLKLNIWLIIKADCPFKNINIRLSYLFLILFNFEGPEEETQKRETVVKDGGLAQLGERLPCKQEVSGSIPLISTKKKSLRANSSAG